LNNSPPKKTTGRLRFSLWYLIIFTAIVAAWTSAIVARQKLLPLQKLRDSLAPMATHLEVSDSTKVVVKRLPQVAREFESFEVYVPEGKPREVRFFCGDVSEAGLPPEFESVPLSPGQHQIVFQKQDRPSDGYRFQLYIDDERVLNKSMGKEWMPLGWRQANSLNPWNRSPSWMPLTGRRYRPSVDYGKNNYFNGHQAQLATWPGYQLWIDEVGRIPEPISDIIGYGEHIGLRDGPRISNPSWMPALGLKFNHPAGHCYDSFLSVVPEFVVGDKVFSAAIAEEPAQWALSRSADFVDKLNRDDSWATKSHSVFLHTTTSIGGKIAPVIELHWTIDRPNDVGLRLPAVLANASITRWRLRSVEGTSHLWRIMESGDRNININRLPPPADTKAEKTDSVTNQVAIPLESSDQGIQTLNWRTNITLPLQIEQRNGDDSEELKDIDVYKGLPFKFGYEIQASADAKAWAIYRDNIPLLETPIPGGRVIDEVVIELDAKDPSWTWLRLEPLEKEQ